MKNSYKFLFILSMIMGTLIAISATSWFSIWMGLEINLLSFIPLMMSSKNLFSSESSLKYFLTQALASAIFLFIMILYYFFLNYKIDLLNYSLILISSTMLLKSGAAPFHSWFPSVMEGLNWYSNLILMTWQKIAPLMIISYCLNIYLLILIIFLSMIFGSLGGLNQTSLRKLMSFSSINHLGWMMASMINNQNLWMVYFLFYTFLSINMVLIFNDLNLFNLNQTFYINLNSTFKLMIFIPLLSLGGLPPFLGFFPKWLVIENMIFFNYYVILTFMLFLTLITLYFYLRISYSALLLNHKKMNWNFKSNSFKNMKLLMTFSFFSISGLFMINLIYMMM